MASPIGVSEKGLKIERKGKNGSGSITVGPESSLTIGGGPISVSVNSDGSIGGKISGGGFSVGADSKGGFTATTPVGGISYNSDGSGEITAPFGIAKVEVERSGCTYILRTYVAGSLIDTEVREIPDCQEPPPSPPPPPEPPPPGSFTPFDPGAIDLPNNINVIATFNWHFKENRTNFWNESATGPGSETIENDYNQDTTGDIPNEPFTYVNNYEYKFEGNYWPGYGWVYDIDHTYVLFSALDENGEHYRHKEKRVGTLWTQSNQDACHVNDNWELTFLGGYNCPVTVGPANYNYDPNWIIHHYKKPHSFENGYPKYYYGSWERLKQYISEIQHKLEWNWSDRSGGGFGYSLVELANLRLYSTYGEGPENTIISGPTMANCCKESKVDLARLEEKLDMLLQVTEAEPLTKKGYTIPASLIAFGSDKKQLEIKSIPAYLQYIMREIDHYGISPIKINIKDIDPTQEGDQSLSEQYINGTAAIKRILELLHGQKGTDKLRLNLQARIASMLDMVLASVTAINELLESITVYIDMPLKEKIEKYKQPWDPYIGLKGFSQKQAWEKELNKKLKEDMEKNIADMCNDSERSVVVQKFNGKADRLVQLIQKLLIGMKH